MDNFLSLTVWGFLLLGAVSGTLSGLLGIGSGAILIPALVLIFGFPQKSAQGTALAVMVTMVTIGAVRYYRNPNIDIDLFKVALISGGAVCGVFIGTHFAAQVPASVLRKIFAIFLLVISLRMLFFQEKRPLGTVPATSGMEQLSEK